MTHPIPFMRLGPDTFVGTIRPDSVTVGSGLWEDSLGNTSDADLIDAVTDQADSVYILPQATGLDVCPQTENKAIEFGFEDVIPAGTETVTYRVRARYQMPLGGTGSATMRMRVREGTTTRATKTGITLTTSFAWYELVMTEAEVQSVDSWHNIRGFADAEVCVDNDLDEIDFQITEEEIVFS